jgi:hypothetical protein
MKLFTSSSPSPHAFSQASCLRFVRGMDELERRIQLEAWLFAALGSLIVGSIINTLNTNGVPLGSVKHGMNIGGTFALTFALWLVGSAVANRRYK